MQLGTAIAEPGTLATGYLEVAELPTGIPERLPVVIADGEAEGPELWITATIHGDETNGLAVAQDIMAEQLPEDLCGRVVCIPNLNPAGLRRNTRASYYHNDDPNRYFPAPDLDRDEPPGLQELINEQVFEAFADSADVLLDLHTAAITAYPFNIRHRVMYGDCRTEAAARELAEEQGRLMEAFGLPIVNQYEDYTERNLHRSTTGAALNHAGIPAMTVELGGHSVIDDDVVAAGVAGCYQVMEAMEMIGQVPAAISEADPGYESPVGYPVKRADGPYTDTPGVVRNHLDRREAFESGDTIATIVTTHGVEKTTITAERDGYLINRCVGPTVYENDAIASVVVRDESDVVVPEEPEDEDEE